MTIITFVASLLIISGAVVMLISIFKYKKTIQLANSLLSENKKRIHRLENIHLVLMYCFFVGYLSLLGSLIAGWNVAGDLFTGIIFFGGAIFVLIGILLQKNMLLSIRLHNEQLMSKNNQLIQTEDVTIFALAYQAEIRDLETGKHLERSSLYVKILAHELALLPKYRSCLSDEHITNIVKAAPLHDIGKVGVPDLILKKEGKLTFEEFESMKMHCEYGAKILHAAEKKLDFRSFLAIAIDIIMGHHEKWDGNGYPYGLKGDDIPLPARIMALADVYDALTTKRCYKKAISHEDSCLIIKKDKGKHFDPDVVEAFLRQEDAFLRVLKVMED